MIPFRLLTAAALVSLVGSTACTSSDAPKGGSDAGHSPGTDSGAEASTAPAGFALTWRIVESGAVGAGADTASTDPTAVRNLPSLAGVKVCVYQKSDIPCVTSDSGGVFVVRGLAARTDYVLTTEKTGYVKTLRAIEMAGTDVDNSAAPLITSKSSSKRPDLGLTYDDTKGAVSFFALGLNADGGFGLPDGVKITLSPKTADGPFFTTPRNTFDQKATATVGGVGLFFNVVPGDYTITFEHPTLDCVPISTPLSAWGFPAPPNGAKFPVLSGYLTDQIGALCTPKSVIVGVDSGTSHPPSDAGAPSDAAAHD